MFLAAQWLGLHTLTAKAWVQPLVRAPRPHKLHGMANDHRGICLQCWLSLSGREIPWERSGCPLQCSCLKNPIDRATWQATVQRTAKRQTQLSSHAYIYIHTL